MLVRLWRRESLYWREGVGLIGREGRGEGRRLTGGLRWRRQWAAPLQALLVGTTVTREVSGVMKGGWGRRGREGDGGGRMSRRVWMWGGLGLWRKKR